MEGHDHTHGYIKGRTAYSSQLMCLPSPSLARPTAEPSDVHKNPLRLLSWVRDTEGGSSLWGRLSERTTAEV